MNTNIDIYIYIFIYLVIYTGYIHIYMILTLGPKVYNADPYFGLVESPG